MSVRRSIACALPPCAVPASLAALLAATCLSPPAAAQTSFIAPDGRNRFPAVTIFCPSGNGVAPCVFGGGGSGGGGGGGAVTINLAGGAVSANNRFPVTDAAVDGLISAGALNVAGNVSVGNFPGVQAVSQSGSWMVGLGAGASVAVSALPALPAGGNAIGSVSVSNLPAVQPVSGAVGQAGSWTMGLATGSSVAVSALPALPSGTNTIGAVTIAGTPNVTCTGCGGSGGGAVSQGAGAAANPWWMQGLGGAGAPAGGVVSVQGVSGGVALPVSGVVSVVALPALPAGGNAIGSVSITGTPTVTCANCGGGGAAGAVTQPDLRATAQLAAGTANAAIVIPLQNGAATVGLTVTGLTASGATLIVEGSYDGGTTWTPVQTVSALTGILTSTVAADRQFSVAAGGRTAVRLRVLAAGSGMIAVADNVSVAPRDMSLAAPLPQGSNLIGSVSVSNLPVTQPISGAVSQAGAWSVGLASGSAVAVSALPALPAGGNAIGSVSVSNLPVLWSKRHHTAACLIFSARLGVATYE